MTEFTSEQISAFVRQYVKETLQNDEKCRYLDESSLEGRTMLEASGMKSDEAESLLTAVNRWLKNNDHELMYPVAKKILSEQVSETDQNSETFKSLSRELLKGFKDILRVRIKRSEGDYSQPDEELIPALKSETNQSVQMAPGDDTVKASGVKFSEIQAHYVAEAEQGKTWAAKTHREYIATFELFIRIMGDLDVTTIDRIMMSKYKDTLLKLPPNMNKSAEYRDKSIKEILAMKPEKRRSPKTVNMNTMRVSSLFSYAVKNGYMSSNPAADLQIKINKRADQQREAFSPEDLDKLFNSPDYKNVTHKHPYRFWIPLIALYSGCRLEEICQLHLEDIRKEDNVWVVHFPSLNSVVDAVEGTFDQWRNGSAVLIKLCAIT